MKYILDLIQLPLYIMWAIMLNKEELNFTLSIMNSKRCKLIEDYFSFQVSKWIIIQRIKMNKRIF